MLNWVVWNRTVLHLTVCKQKAVLMLDWIVWNKVKPFNCVQKMSSDLSKNVIFKRCLKIIYLIYV